ncbi:MAG: glutamate 5-kinase [Rhodobacterales bacterium]|nr:MAG: glutamate 5-kinase [Rhodobacterales bacterium]
MATLKEARRIVVKVGSALLVDAATGALRADWLASLAADVARLKARGADLVLVSSGSIALGRGVLGLAPGSLPLEQSQAAAAVGQIQLARAYEEALQPLGITTAQVLVTLEDSADRRRYLNVRATLETLLSLGAVPIVNENDTVATDEIRFGDNDRLAAQVAVTVGADLTVLLSDVDGFYSGNPKQDPTARRYEVVDEITPALEAQAGEAGTGMAKGGMKTKVMAAKTATAAGSDLMITLGEPLNPLAALEAGAAHTLFRARGNPASARKHWISSMKPRGSIRVDAGAVRALGQGNSLLPAGITGVTGDFGRGDPVDILGPRGERIGAGLTRYTGDEARALIGKHSHEIEAVLGYAGRATLIHRDDMAL